MDQVATWYGGRPRRRPHCVSWGPSSPHAKGHSSPPPTFRCMCISLFLLCRGRVFCAVVYYKPRPCLLWRNGHPSQLWRKKTPSWRYAMRPIVNMPEELGPCDGRRQHAQKFGKDRTYGSGDILADRQTDTHRQTYSSPYFATVPAGEVKNL